MKNKGKVTKHYKFRVGSVVTVRGNEMEVVGMPDGANEYWVRRDGIIITYDAKVFDQMAKLVKA
jgi:hypothetical protein